MQKASRQSSAFDKYLAVKEEAIVDLLQERESLKQQLKEQTATLAKLLHTNAKRLAELGYEIKDAALAATVSGKNLRLDDETIKKSLSVLLSRKQLSIPSICQHLHIARSRFTAFERRHKSFLGKKGKGKLTVYFLKNAST
jgi:hypothetical protein